MKSLKMMSVGVLISEMRVKRFEENWTSIERLLREIIGYYFGIENAIFELPIEYIYILL